MNKYKYLIKNMGFLFIGNFTSKILVFLLVPLYTSVLTTAEYGSYDLLYTTAQMLMPVLSLNVIDAVMRFSINESKERQDEVFTSGVKYVVLSCIILTLGVNILCRFMHIDILSGFELPFLLLYITYTLNQFCNQFARGIDDISGISIAGIVGTVLMLGLNIWFLLVLRTGLMGYFYANIISFGGQALILIIRNKFWKYFSFKNLSFRIKAYEKEMLAYSLPLIFTTLSWYINNVSDRYVVTLMCGVAINGIYAVAYKIPAILNMIQVIFIQAWQLSAIKEFGTEEGNRFYNQIYQAGHSIMVVMCSVLIVMTRFIAKILFANEFFEAWYFVPTLLIYIVFNTLSGIIGGVFSATKDTAAFAKSAVVGALSNLGLNFILVYWWGAQGAAIATVISSLIIWGMRLLYSKKHMKWTVNLKKHCVEYVVLALQAAALVWIMHPVVYVIETVLCFVLIGMNLKIVLKIRRK